MKKRNAFLLSALYFIFAINFTVSGAIPSDNFAVIIDGQQVFFDGQSPVVINGRMLVPVRGVFEKLGFDVDWDRDENQVGISRDDSVISVNIGSYSITVNGESINTDAPAQIINGRTMLPLRIIFESVGYSIEWDTESGNVIASSIARPDNLPPLGGETDSAMTNREIDLTVAGRINGIISSAYYISDVVGIVGTPIEKIGGATDSVVFEHEGNAVITEYYFRVIDWVFGEPGEEIIHVRTQVGNVLEIGREYTIAPRHLNNVFFNTYIIGSNSQILNNADATESELEFLWNSLSEIDTTRFEQPRVFAEAVPTEEFMRNVDVAIIATVTGILQFPDEIYSNVLSASLELRQIVKGDLRDDILDSLVRLRGDVAEGNTYLILFIVDENGNLTLAARNGAIIPENSTQFYIFMRNIFAVA